VLLALGGLVRRLGLSSLAYWALGATPTLAQEPPSDAKPPAPEAPDSKTLEARGHFKSGTKLYRDGNYGGALAEFEEAYRLKPGAGSLQNVALSQKGLFRYSEAAGTLEQLLAKHAAELSDGERQAVTDALTELKGLIASIKLRVEPEHSRVLLGRSCRATGRRQSCSTSASTP
jgi:tetratricopeptide (TPR) repeat protein